MLSVHSFLMKIKNVDARKDLDERQMRKIARKFVFDETQVVICCNFYLIFVRLHIKFLQMYNNVVIQERIITGFFVSDDIK